VEYRKFGKLGLEVSVLGFGCMRLPVIDGVYGNIDEPEATRIVRRAIDGGVNYLDTAYGYHDHNSERLLGRALQDGYREKVYLATKLPVWNVKTADDFDRLLNEQLAKLRTEHIDMYLLHGLDKGEWTKVRDLGVLDWAEVARGDGRIHHLGFSFHDEVDVFKEIVDAYDRWVFCQIQYNYMDVENQAGTKGLQYAASEGLAVIVMEGLLGGKLVNPPPDVQALWDSAATQRTPADWALQWLWDHPEVTVVLSGMSTIEQVEQNLASAGRSAASAFTQEELELVAKVRGVYDSLCPIPCTNCNYCMPCPNGVEIPRNFAVYNMGVMYNNAGEARDEYKGIQEAQRADACIQCRECEEKCPQHILISEWMPIVDDVLAKGQAYVCALP
jgi:predicted aldo/keto reductase-like oxidoreductase